MVASEKGVVVGRLQFTEDGDPIDCSRMGVGGKAIPPNTDKACSATVNLQLSPGLYRTEYCSAGSEHAGIISILIKLLCQTKLNAISVI